MTNIGLIRFSNLIIIIFLLVFLVWLGVQHSSRISLDPRSYPYRLAAHYEDRSSIPPSYVHNARFLSDSVLSVLSFKEERGNYKFSIGNYLQDARDIRTLGPSNIIDEINYVDINDDGTDELFHVLSFPQIPDIDDTVQVDSVLLWARDSHDRILTLDRIIPADIPADIYSTGSRIPWSATARVLHEVDMVTPLSSNGYFALGVWGSGSARTSRWVYIYRSGNPPHRIARIKTPFYPTSGQWHLLPDSGMALTVCGSSYKYGSNDPVRWDGRRGWIIQDFIDDINDAVIQVDTDGKLRWTLQLGVKIGETGIWADDDFTKPLIVFYHRDLFPEEGDREATTVLKINRSTGEVIDSVRVYGRIFPFTGYAARECEYLGLIQYPDRLGQLLRKDGNLEPRFNINRSNDLSTSPVLRFDKNSLAFAASFGDSSLLLYNFKGDIIAVANGAAHTIPMRITEAGKYKDVLLVKAAQSLLMLEVVENSPFWWIWRYRWFLLTILLSPFLFMINMRILDADKRSHASMMKSFQEMENNVQERTDELSEANRLLAFEVKQRRKAEDELRKSHRHLEAIFNGVYDGLISLDEEMRITSSNAAFGRMFKIESGELAGKRLDEVFDSSVEALVLSVNQTRQANTAVHDYQVEVRSSEGIERIVQVTAMPLHGSEELPGEILLVLRDVTQLYTLKSRIFDEYRFRNIIGQSPQMQQVFHLISEISETVTTVLITGESGTGKELVANAIHYNSPRADGQFVAVNCASLSESLLESELFGHVKGSFTSATRDRKGLFEAAQGGTIFLDEIGDISPTMQAKLLRVIQEGEYIRVGESLSRRTDARIIAATNQDLGRKIEEDKFRRDLYYRLNVFAIHLAPLRERSGDIPLLIDHFMQEFNKSLNRAVERVSDVAMERLMNYEWRGNVRELKNIINGAMILCHEDTLEPRHFHPDFFLQQERDTETIPESTKREDVSLAQPSDGAAAELLEVLKRNFWNVTKTARQLGVSRTHIYNKMKKLGLERPR